MNMPPPELIYFKSCPFAQQVLITLLHRDIAHQRTLINPSERPDWLVRISPQGQIPVLRLDDKVALFESSAILEYLDAISGGGLISNRPMERAQSQSWIQFIGSCQTGFGQLITAANEESFQKARHSYLQKIAFLENGIDTLGPFFTGETFSLVDIALAPLLMRLHELSKLVRLHATSEFPRLQELSRLLLAQPAVQSSIADLDFPVMFRSMIHMRGADGYVDSLIR
ncbi:MAG: glutathione S-transferase family protein [Magnetococcus sp. DMHC-6]